VLSLSVDRGASWIDVEDSVRSNGWVGVTVSADGKRLLALDPFGGIRGSSGFWAFGGLAGGAYDMVELQYMGNGSFKVLGHTGILTPTY
jgi:hypothetical protein